MAQREELADEQGTIIEPLLPPCPVALPAEAGRGKTAGQSLMASSGSYGVAPAGKTCRTVFPRTRPNPAGSSRGCGREGTGGCWKLLLRTCATAASYIWYLLMAPLWWPKKGVSGGKDQEGKRDEAHRHWSSCRRPHGVCFPACSHPGRTGSH